MDIDIKRKLKHLDEFVVNYRLSRNEHMSKWHTFATWLARVHGAPVVFDALRNSDLEFFHRMRDKLFTHLDEEEISQNEIGELVLYLKGHRSILSERDFFLVVYIAIISVILIIPRDGWLSWVLIGSAILFGLVGAIERWNMKRNDSIYNEMIELLQHKMKND